jgi:hypothetical protein
LQDGAGFKKQIPVWDGAIVGQDGESGHWQPPDRSGGDGEIRQ